MDKIVNKSLFCVFLAIFNTLYIHKFQLELLLICVFMSNFNIKNKIFCKKKAPIKGTFEYLADLVFDPTLAYWRVRLGLPHY